MTDLEMTKLCAQAMGLAFAAYPETGQVIAVKSRVEQWLYNPLNDDAHAMALVKKFRLYIEHGTGLDRWTADNGLGVEGESEDLNRAIVECVAKMQKEKT